MQTLVLARRQNVLAALRALEMTEEDLKDPRDPTRLRDASDDVLIQRILWKLGFDRQDDSPITADFWRHHREMTHQLREVSANAHASVEAIRNAGTSFFVELEHVLDDSLMFAWWILTNDHPGSAEPFAYTHSQGEAAWAGLHEFWRASQGAPALNLADRRTLHTLGMAYRVLAQYLRMASADADGYVRVDAEKPKYAGKTELRKSPFAHTCLFLDLTEDSKATILGGLDAVTESLVR